MQSQNQRKLQQCDRSHQPLQRPHLSLRPHLRRRQRTLVLRHVLLQQPAFQRGGAAGAAAQQRSRSRRQLRAEGQSLHRLQPGEAAMRQRVHLLQHCL